MAQLKIIRAEETEPQDMRHGKEAGQVKRIIATEKFFFNIDEVNPGHSPHHWHRHVKYRTETHEVDYPADFEEIYFIVSGRGVIQWKTDSGETREQKVGPGDTIHMPADVVEHQLLNNGSETIRLAVVGVPPPRRTPLTVTRRRITQRVRLSGNARDGEVMPRLRMFFADFPNFFVVR